MSLAPGSDAVLFWKIDKTAFCPVGQSLVPVAGVEPPEPPEFAPPHLAVPLGLNVQIVRRKLLGKK